jgi:hypothetical protein
VTGKGKVRSQNENLNGHQMNTTTILMAIEIISAMDAMPLLCSGTICMSGVTTCGPGERRDGRA